MGTRSHHPGMTPLMAAVTGGKHKVIKALLKAAPTATDIANAEGYSVMHVAADLGRDRVIQILITHGLDPRDRHEDGEYSHSKYTYLPFVLRARTTLGHLLTCATTNLLTCNQLTN